MVDITRLIAGSDSESDGEQDVIWSSDQESEKDSPDKQSDFKFPKLDSDEEDEEKIVFARTEKRHGGSFAKMGLSRLLLSNIQRKGFKIPTPIQRKAMPLILDGKDVVGMARTGSGKTAAFALPLIDRLKTHSSRMGVRGLILSPNRELSVQTAKVVREFARGSGLRCSLIIGGDSIDSHFSEIMGNPDIIVATPGRLLHLVVEMELPLSTVEYVVFDEADRLFEMGFAEQLQLILGRLPPTRQTLLFSATLPSTLIAFAKAGLQDPKLIRLDTETQISEELQMAFFGVREDACDTALLYILNKLIQLPQMTDKQRQQLAQREKDVLAEEDRGRRSGRDQKQKQSQPQDQSQHQHHSSVEIPSAKATIIFVPTMHHVEYIAGLLQRESFAVSFIYGALDQVARREQLYRFRAGITSVMVVTDVAARGVDIPLLANVVNYSMPPSSRVFVHRVGRTARAGHTGWAYTLVRSQDLPYLGDLEIFLGRKVVTQRAADEFDYTQQLVLGALPSLALDFYQEHIAAELDRDSELSDLRRVALRGDKRYMSTREGASKEGARRAHEWLAVAPGASLTEAPWYDLHPLVAQLAQQPGEAGSALSEKRKEEFLARLGSRRQRQTVFEFKKTGTMATAELMARRRAQLAPVQERAQLKHAAADAERAAGRATQRKSTEFYVSHQAPGESLRERGYDLEGTAGFVDDARRIGYGLENDGEVAAPKQISRWDKKHGKYVKGGSDTTYIRDEGGRRIPATLQTGRFARWKQEQGLSAVPKPGAPELEGAEIHRGPRYKHTKMTAPKPVDKARDDYHKRKARVARALELGMSVPGAPRPSLGVRSAGAIQHERAQKRRRREKSGPRA